MLTDDLAWNLVRYMPHVQQMERRGATFTRYFVTDSLCCPSRATIFSGRYPHDTGVYSNNGINGGFHIFHARGEERSTFATALAAAGYRTAMMGKYLNGYKPHQVEGGVSDYIPPGWSEWDVAGDGYPEFNYVLNENGRRVRYGHRPRDYMTTVIGGLGVRFINRAASAHSPFMLELSTFAPHAPFVPAPRDRHDFPHLQAPRTPAFDNVGTNAPAWLRRFRPLTRRNIRVINRDFRRRVQSVQAVDRMIGRIEKTLAARGLSRNTYFVFSSDNGLHMGEHRMLPGKLTAFDTDIRVPLVVVGPGVPHGDTISALTENTDLAPTFERLAGETPPAQVEGRSLIPLLHGQRAKNWRSAVLIEHRGPVLGPGDPDLPTAGAGNPTSYEAIRTANSLYVEYADGEREYYDLKRDPNELDNLAAGLAPGALQGGRLTSAALSPLNEVLRRLEDCHDGASCRSAASRTP